MARKKHPPDRFWALVQRSEEPDGCWWWIGATAGGTGYGVFNDGDNTVLAHRYSFKITRPSLDIEGLIVRHRCDNPLCVNPRHLRIGTQKDNVRDMDERGRRVNKPAVGEAHGHSKMEAWQVVEARWLHREYPEMGWTISKLAKKYGVSYSTMSAILKGRTWKHV